MFFLLLLRSFFDAVVDGVSACLPVDMCSLSTLGSIANPCLLHPPFSFFCNDLYLIASGVFIIETWFQDCQNCQAESQSHDHLPQKRMFSSVYRVCLLSPFVSDTLFVHVACSCARLGKNDLCHLFLMFVVEKCGSRTNRKTLYSAYNSIGSARTPS